MAQICSMHEWTAMLSCTGSEPGMHDALVLIYLFVSPLEDDCKGSVSDEVFSAVFKVPCGLHFFDRCPVMHNSS